MFLQACVTQPDVFRELPVGGCAGGPGGVGMGDRAGHGVWAPGSH